METLADCCWKTERYTPPKSLSSSSLKLASFRTCFGTGSGFVDAKLTLRLLEMAPVVAATWQLDRVRWLC